MRDIAIMLFEIFESMNGAMIRCHARLATSRQANGMNGCSDSVMLHGLRAHDPPRVRILSLR